MNGDKYTVILFYKFVDIQDPKGFVEAQKELCSSLGLKGRMIVAGEGVNATFEGTDENIQEYKKRWKEEKLKDLFGEIIFKESEGNGKAFTKLQIKVRPEIVTLGAGTFDVNQETAPTVTADELESMYERAEKGEEDFVILDLRNNFEIEAGYFDKTLNPGLKNFRDLPQVIKKWKEGKMERLEGKKIVAVCTGGIRCEKATCLLKKEGLDNIYQLKDGIHTYMQKYPGRKFKGSLFVFDNRMVTPVVDTPNREIVGKCIFCEQACEKFYSDDSTRPSKKIICCERCFVEKGKNLRNCV